MINIQTPEEAEAVFYEAFMHGDIEVMAALWAEDAVCVHPGSAVIQGYEAVVRSWSHILENTRGSEIRYSINNKTATDDIAVHVVTEELMDGSQVMAVVLSTNVYQRFEQGWMMIEHHGSLVQPQHQGETLQ